ncbi:MAG: YpiF family protein [Candidatus Pristimantibacillus lignocellulolyticus]|uniref:YpiF family protein n=1 Tax=Candidatus Pristimantibacillus lignocellulolyticus TaxID=2994561 RepID=A0A9J6ZDX6_9BACL|nr:MAG: YpiF family protein [Candidatus Pristimantibacillus lignocellulolyticus]
MKFSEIEQEQWEELKPYLDTCLLPITGLDGSETPVETTIALENLRDIMDLVELPFKGRVVTYPACHYISHNPSAHSQISAFCSALKAQGFKYIILITAKLHTEFQINEADLWITPTENGENPSAEQVNLQIRELWRHNNS